MGCASDDRTTTLTAEVPRSMPSVSADAGIESDMGPKLPRDIIRRFQRTVDILIGVRKGYEQVLERPGVEQNVALQHALPPAPEDSMVGVSRSVAVIVNRLLGEPHLQDGSQSHHVRG